MPKLLLIILFLFSQALAFALRCTYPHLVQSGDEVMSYSFQHAVEKLQANFRNGPPTTRDAALAEFKKRIYNAVAGRAEPDRLEYHFPWTAEENKKYEAAVAALNVPNGVSDGYRHFAIAAKPAPAPTLQIGNGPKVAINYKSYFTVPLPKKGSGPESFIRFTQALPKLREELVKLNEKCQGCILQFKIPPDLETLTNRVDGLVIHYTDPKIAPEVNAAVARAFGPEQPFQARPLRGETGFDFAGSASHGQLIAELTARYLVAKGRDNLLSTPKEELARQLRAYTLEISRWSPEQIYQKLYLATP